jgi:ribonuclease HI
MKYVCDGSSFQGKMGAGVVRMGKRKVEKYHFSHTQIGRKNVHELFAISCTLDIIESYQDYEVIIYNDDALIVKQLNDPSSLKQRSAKRLHHVLEKLQNLEEKGYSISFVYAKEMIHDGYLKTAHHLSRYYLERKNHL